MLVIRAKAPTTPSGSKPAPWPAPRDDLRYWSICDDLKQSPIPVVVNRLPDGKVDEGCRYDSQVKLDQNGYYTIVVGTETQSAAIERIPGTTFLPFSAAGRRSCTSSTCATCSQTRTSITPYAIQNVPANGNPSSAEAVMGPYYPQAGFCSLATLAHGGPNACLPGNT